MVRGPYYDKHGVKRGAWSKDEDERLRAYVERNGHSNWRQVPKYAGLSRCGKSCRLRWVNYLRPNLKRGNYTQEEDEIIIKLHEQHGNKWSLISERLPERTDNEVKNYWHSHLKKRLECNHEKIEFKMEPSDNYERETAQYSESENPMLGVAGAPSCNILESSPPIYNSSSSFTFREKCDANAALKMFEEFDDFWTQPFISENTYTQDNYYSPNYAANLVDMDQYPLYFFDNAEFFCQGMQEMPKDPKGDI